MEAACRGRRGYDAWWRPGRADRPDDGSATPPLVPPADHLDRLIHERLRLGIISALTA